MRTASVAALLHRWLSLSCPSPFCPCRVTGKLQLPRTLKSGVRVYVSKPDQPRLHRGVRHEPVPLYSVGWRTHGRGCRDPPACVAATRVWPACEAATSCEATPLAGRPLDFFATSTIGGAVAGPVNATQGHCVQQLLRAYGPLGSPDAPWPPCAWAPECGGQLYVMVVRKVCADSRLGVHGIM